MTSAEFWASPIPVPKPPIKNSFAHKSKGKDKQLPAPIETREEERDGRTYTVKVLPSFTKRATPMPKGDRVGEYSIGEDGSVDRFKPTGTEDY